MEGIITVRCIVQGEQHAVLSISDTGVGIPEEDLGRSMLSYRRLGTKDILMLLYAVFDRFHRVQVGHSVSKDISFML